jgi:hypothetical protein
MAQIMRSVVRTVWSDGGQRVARRNAWASMAADCQRARQRAEAAAVMDALNPRHEMPAAQAASLRG